LIIGTPLIVITTVFLISKNKYEKQNNAVIHECEFGHEGIIIVL
jgi:hypothetical protein